MQSPGFPGREGSRILVISLTSVDLVVVVWGSVLFFPNCLDGFLSSLEAWRVFGDRALCRHSSLPREVNPRAAAAGRQNECGGSYFVWAFSDWATVWGSELKL